MQYSIIIPIYNFRALFCMLKHLYTTDLNSFSHEILICDDWSSEFYIRNYKKICNGFPKIHFLHHELCDGEFRAAKARNLWINAAKGKYSVFLDQDCILHMNYFSILQHETRPDVIQSGQMLWYNNIKKRLYYDDLIDFYHDGNLMHKNYTDIRKLNTEVYWQEWTTFFWTNFTIQTQCIREIWWFCEDFVWWWWEDLELWLRLFKKNIKISFSSTVCILNISTKLYDNVWLDGDLNKTESMRNNMKRLLSKHPDHYVVQHMKQLLTLLK